MRHCGLWPWLASRDLHSFCRLLPSRVAPYIGPLTELANDLAMRLWWAGISLQTLGLISSSLRAESAVIWGKGPGGTCAGPFPARCLFEPQDKTM